MRAFQSKISISALALALLSVPASADMSDSRYLEALKIADQYVQRKKAIANDPNALSSTVIRALLGRYYRVGDAWVVAAYQEYPTLMRRVDQPEMLEQKSGKVGLFRYEVTQVKTGAAPEVTLKVTQLNQSGIAPVDAGIEYLTLKMNDKLKQGEKAYKVRGAQLETAVSPDGIRSRITDLELFPLDVPEVELDLRQDVRELPRLPAALQKVAQDAGFRPDVARSGWFEQDDFFGRPVQILWQQGDPWPAYLKTTHGVAILLRKEVQQ